jgi:curli biogenesis system outer membrane secretion channel CsgG
MPAKNSPGPLVLLFASCLAFTPASAQQIEYSEAEAAGAGRDEAAAIQDALKGCVAQVCGVSIATETRLEVVVATLSANGKDTNNAREKLNDRIETATKGRVASYRVISEARATDAGAEVRVSAKIAKYKSGQANRLRLAFMPLRAARDGYVCDGETLSGVSVSSQLIHALSQKIVSSRKFMVLDREYVDEVAAEQKTISESSDEKDMGKLGAILGADYIIAGTVENFGMKEEVVGVGGISVDRKRGGAAVALRVIDVTTGQIKFSETINTVLTIKRGISSASMSLAEQVADVSAAKIVEAIYPLLAIALEDGELVLNQGGEMIKAGDRYELFALGEMLKDPRTGENLGRKETKIGVAEITRSKPKTADAKVIETAADIAGTMQTKTILCRPLKTSPAPASSLKQQLNKENLW